jgi:hypothetical protein
MEIQNRLQRYRNLGSRDPKVVLLNHVPVQRNRNRRVRRPAESQPTTGWHMKVLVTLRPTAPACRRPRLLLLHGTSTATVTTTWNLPSNVATRLKLGMLTRRIGVGSFTCKPERDRPFPDGFRIRKGRSNRGSV